MTIPKQLQHKGINFVLLEKGGKKPFEIGWQKKQIEFDDPRLMQHLVEKGNYGVRGGGNKKLLIVDFDDEKVQKECLNKLPDTFKVKTGRGLLHLYYFSDGSESFKIFDEEVNTLADIQGEGKQVVGVGSIHPNGNPYEVFEDKDISFIPYSELKATLMFYNKKPIKEKPIQKEYPKIDLDENFIDIAKSNVIIENILGLIGIDTSFNPTECPFHSSKGGKCLGFERDVAHCFHCDDSWNIFSLVTQYKNCSFKEALEFIADNFGLKEKYDECKKKYIEKLKEKEYDEKKEIRYKYLDLISGKEKHWSEATELLVLYICDKLKIYTTRDDLKSEMWIYHEGVYIPQGKSRIREILRKLLEENYSSFVYNHVVSKIEPDTFIDNEEFFNTNYKNEIPVENGILNINTLELKPFDQKKIFFNKFPVIFDSFAKCPKIDKFLKNVLANEEDVKVFYEWAGFGLLKEYKFEKAIMLVGDGRNGKGKSIELLKRLVGTQNCCSIPLSSLIPDSFSISELFGKMFNLGGDIGNKDLRDTSTFKTATGRDLIGGKRKFQRDIYFENYAKFTFACNELPTVYDMSKGFWDRWILLEFPYTFVTQEEYDDSLDKTNLKIRDEDIINKISTKEEMSGLLNQALFNLKEISNNHKFSTTIGSEEVKSTWIKKSNSFMAFCYDHIKDDVKGYISKKDLRKRYSQYCQLNKIKSKSDYVIKTSLQDMYGTIEENKKDFGSDYWETAWTGIKWV
ncbi:hypothetical protein LCGC14_0632820 [marine sediment metagenome]|uniref:SF3 helicase domain-containing protein n=1 Tax=marine sediment metagenome TaxID=412755 RepID=A0A0F9TMZ1_9ZZZZ